MNNSFHPAKKKAVCTEELKTKYLLKQKNVLVLEKFKPHLTIQEKCQEIKIVDSHYSSASR